MDLMVPKNRSPSLTVFVKDYDVTKSTTEQRRSFKNNYFSITFSNYLNKECTYFQRKRTPCVSLLELVIQNKVYRQTDFGIPFYSLLSFFRKFIKSYQIYNFSILLHVGCCQTEKAEQKRQLGMLSSIFFLKITSPATWVFCKLVLFLCDLQSFRKYCLKNYKLYNAIIIKMEK